MTNRSGKAIFSCVLIVLVILALAFIAPAWGGQWQRHQQHTTMTTHTHSAISSTASVTLNSTDENTTGILYVNSVFGNGTSAPGMYVELRLSGSSRDIAACYSPCSFLVTLGTNYQVFANSYGTTQFYTWGLPTLTTANPIGIEIAINPLQPPPRTFTLPAMYR